MTLAVPCPGSKSMTQRALVMAALGRRGGSLRGALVCDDSRYLSQALRTLGGDVTWQDTEVEVTSCPLEGGESVLFCGNAGTAVRFLSGLGLVARSPYTVDGDDHMRGRPLAAMADALTALGARVSFPAREGYPPMRIEPRAPEGPSSVSVDGSLSSQYATGLLLAAPRLPGGLRLHLTGDPVSRPYLDMTVAMMSRAGAEIHWADGNRLVVEAGDYTDTSFDIEPDWSAAAFLMAAAYIVGRDIRIPGLLPPGESLQGDSAFALFLDRVRTGGPQSFDLTHVPDLLPPLVAAALFADGPTRIRGAAHTRVKESDRLAVLARGLRTVGAQVTEHPDGMDLEPLDAPHGRPVTLDPDDDHRMAMAFGLMSLRIPGITIENPDCVTKSFPDFWSVLDLIAGGSGPGNPGRGESG
ncbi:MAG: 3-phosphoshikimate 1-carboxyvinyltransferase [Gemmatimonadetes bacterium]|nr:3-phosphoshikimate 1-carboxyvinyltransferase [Gemmatimonadota bacterium]